MERYRVLFNGQVQGVGFRAFCKYVALEHQLTGYVSNLEDFEYVEAEFQGEKENIIAALKIISKGNMFIKVEDYQMKKLPYDEKITKFQIK